MCTQRIPNTFRKGTFAATNDADGRQATTSYTDSKANTGGYQLRPTNGEDRDTGSDCVASALNWFLNVASSQDGVL